MKKFFQCKKLLALLVSVLLILSTMPSGLLSVSAVTVSPLGLQSTEIKSVHVEDVVTEEGKNGYRTSEYDQFGELLGRYFYYNITPSNITIECEDGSIYSGNLMTLQMQLSVLIYTNSDQSYANQWHAGTYKASLIIEDKEVEYNVIINPSPIKSLAVDDVLIYENNGGYIQYGFNNFGGIDYDKPYYSYQIKYHFTATLNDGSKVSGWSNRGISIGGEWDIPETECIQNYENQWGIGEYNATAFLGGKTAEFKVKILPNPIKSIKVEDASVIKDTDGFLSGEWVYNSETFEYSLTNDYFRYEYTDNLRATAVLYDGREIDAANNVPPEFENMSGMGGWDLSFLIDGVIFNFEVTDDQSYEHPWELGENTAKITCAGVEKSFKVYVIESPIKSVAVDKITLIKDIDSFTDTETGKTAYYLPERPNFTAETYDGEILHSDEVDNSIIVNGRNYSVGITYDSSSWKAGNSYPVQASVCGKDFTFDVEIIENPYESLEISEEDGDLYITFDKIGGGTEKHCVVNFDSRFGGPGVIGGILYTDKLVFSNAVFNYYEPDDEYTAYDKNVFLELGSMKSNTLENCYWLKSMYFGDIYFYQITAYRAYLKTLTHRIFRGIDSEHIDVDDLITIACNSIGTWLAVGEETVGDFTYKYMPVSDVNFALKEVFGLSDIDYTKYTLYDADNPDTIKVLDMDIGYTQAEIEKTYSDGKWQVVAREEESTVKYDFIRITLDDTFAIEKIEFLNDTESDVQPGDITGDGKIDSKDLTRLKKCLAGQSVEYSLAGGDCTGDGKIDSKDLTRLKKYLAGQNVALGA